MSLPLSPLRKLAARRLNQIQETRKSRALLECASLLDFIPVISPRYERPEHLSSLVDVIARSRVEPVRALVSVPPRHSKTETLLHAIAWLLACDPSITVGYVSYAADIAMSKSRLARDYALRAGVRLRDDANSMHEWRTVEGGGVIATGVGGPLTGHGVNLMIIDDPVKNRQDAESALMRQRAHEWFTSTATTRVDPGGSIVCCHTRWHADDLIGRLAASKDEQWESIHFPAINEQGDALWPTRWPLAALEEKRRAIGEYDWAALFQGSPVPRGGQLFKEPARYESPRITGARIVIGVDPAASEKTHADHSVAVVIAVTGHGVNATADVLEVYRAQKEIPALCADLEQLQLKWDAPMAIEAVGVGKAVPQVLKAINPRLRFTALAGADMRADKFSRAQPVAAAWNQGRVRLPLQGFWLREFQSEVQAFTGISDVHDDQVDALAHAWNFAQRSGGGAASSYDDPRAAEDRGVGVSEAEEAIQQRIKELTG